MAKNGSYQSLYNDWTIEPFGYNKNEADYVTMVAGFLLFFLNLMHILKYRVRPPLRPVSPRIWNMS